MSPPLRFLSICSGIEAASVAFRPLGWEALAFAEIDPFPCRLLAHHYPQVPNLGDLTRWREWSPELLAQADVLCGGTPCQAFSVAGLRGSLNDERGNLTLTFCHLYDEIDRQRHLHGRPPAVCLWENVPGVLNTDDNAFGHFLAGLAGEDVPLTPPGARWTDAGYVRGPTRAVAWRVLDAKYFGLAQRRERVFVVASADPAFDPAAVLFELDGLRRDTPPRRGAGEGAAAGTLRSTDGGSDLDHARAGHVLGERMTDQFSVPSSQFSVQNGVPEVIPLAFGGNNTAGPIPTIPTIPALNANRGCHNPGDFEAGALLVEVAHALRAERFDASEDGTGRGTPIVPIAFSSKDHGADATRDLCPTLRAGNHADSHANGGNAPAIAFPERMSGTQCASESELSPVLQSRNPTAVAFQPGNLSRGESDQDPHVAGTVRAGTGSAIQNSSNTVALSAWRVRRLTPEECELLQAFPVGYTLIPGTSSKQRKGADLTDTIDYLISLGLPRPEAEVLAHSPDGPRYKALGNSWAVPVARWIGERIANALDAGCSILDSGSINQHQESSNQHPA